LGKQPSSACYLAPTARHNPQDRPRARLSTDIHKVDGQPVSTGQKSYNPQASTTENSMADRPQPQAGSINEPVARPSGGSGSSVIATQAATEKGGPAQFEPTIISSDDGKPRPQTSLLPQVARERFEFLGVFAKGGVGRIVRAHEPHLGRTVAVKELRQSEPESRERFIREARLTARLQHPGIVPVYDAGCWPGGDPFFSMKLVSGKPFSRVVRRAKTLGQRLALLPHVLAVAEAIAYAHSQKIIHRDLKPQNILVGSFGETVVIDWGLAKDLTQEPVTDTKSPPPSPAPPSNLPNAVRLQDSQISEEGLTITGTVMGTPSYMPPEQAIGLSVDERADVYALGAILYHVLSGRPPYTGDSSVDVLVKVTGGPPPSLTRIQRKLPHELVTIVDKAMARDPEHRYRTASDFADDLRRFQTGKIVGAHNYSPIERLRRFVGRYRAPLISLALLVVMGAISVSEIVQERDLAEQGRREAEQARAVATEQREEARAHSDQLTIEQARIAVKRDSSRVLALLRELSPEFQAWDAARVIAADALAQGLPVVLRGHTATTTNVSFSHDGKTIFSASDDGSIREWNLETGAEIRTLAGHSDEVWVVRVSEDGRQLLSTGKDKTVRLWDLQTGTSQVFSGHKAEIFGVRFLDQNRIASISYDETMQIWDVHSRESVAEYSFHQPNERMFPLIDLSDNSRIFMHENTDGSIGLRDLQTGEIWRVELTATAAMATINATGNKLAVTTLAGKPYAFILSDDRKQFLPVELDYDSTVAAMGFERDNLFIQDAKGGRIVFFDLTTGDKRQFALTLERIGSMVTAPVSATGERWIAAGAGSGVVYLLDANTGTHRTLRKFQDSTLSLEFSRDSTKIAATSFDHTVRVWGVQTPSHTVLARREKPIQFTRYSADGTYLFSGDDSGKVYLHNLSTQTTSPLPGSGNKLSTIATGHTGTRLALGDRAGQIWEWSETATNHHPKLHSGRVRDLTFAGDLLLSAGEDGQVISWPVGQKPRVLATEAKPLRVLAASDDGQSVAWGGRGHVVTVWERATGTTRKLDPFEGTVSALTFSADGQLLIIGSRRHELRVVDLVSGKRVDIDAGGNGVQTICLSRDNTLIYVTNRESTIRVWDVQSGERVANLQGHRQAVQHIALSPEGDRLISASNDRTLRLWSLSPWRDSPEKPMKLRWESRELVGHMRAPVDARFTPDGQAIVSAGYDGTIRLWPDDLPLEPEVFRQWLETTSAKQMNR